MKKLTDKDIENVSGGAAMAAVVLTAVTAVVSAGWILGSTLAERDNKLSCPS